jgi:hypothetical protein
MPKLLKNWPAIPGMKETGTKMAIKVPVGRDHRQANLVRSLDRRLISALAALAHVANDILDLDDRIIDEDSNNER